MAFPVVATTNVTNGSTAAQNKVCNLPASIAAGDGLLLILRSAAADTHTTPTGWTPLILNNTADASLDVFSVWYKKADGSEGATVTVNCTTSLKFGALAWRITGTDFAVEPPDVSTVAVGTSTTPNPPSFTPTNGTQDYLWMWVGSWEGEQTSPPASNPTNYSSNIISANSGAGGAVDTNVRLASATRNLNTGSAEDPGSWTISVSDDWSAITIAITPVDPPDAVPEDGEGYALLHTVARTAIVIGATVVAAASAQASKAPWQDEVAEQPFVGGTVGSAGPMWPAAGTAPRFISGGSDEVLGFSAAPMLLDDYTVLIPYAAQPTLAFPAYVDEAVVEQVVATIVDDVDVAPSFVVPPKVHRLDVIDEVVVPAAVPDPFTGGTAGGIWAASSTTPRIFSLAAGDDIVPQPEPLSIDVDPWTPPFTVPPVRSLGVQQTQDERVAQPVATPALDDGTIATRFVAGADVWIPVPWQFAYNDGSAWQPIDEVHSAPVLYVARPTIALQQQFADDAVVVQPTPVRHDEYIVFPYVAPARVHALVTIDEIIVPQPAPAPIDDGSLFALFVAAAKAHAPVYADELIVEQPAPARDEDYLFVLFSAPRAVHLRVDIDEIIVQQPAPFPAEDGTWTPPFVVPPVRALTISQTQDERAAPPDPLGFDEGAWSAPFTVPPVRWLIVADKQDEIVPLVEVTSAVILKLTVKPAVFATMRSRPPVTILASIKAAIEAALRVIR